MSRLEGRTALVTGASRGFGEAIALRLAHEGADVIVGYRGAEAEARAVAAAIEALGRRALALRADVTDPAQARGMIDAAVDRLGAIDVLVNNAGIRHIAPFADQDAPAWEEMLAVNVHGALHTTHAVLPHMIERGAGRIVNVSSQMAHSGGENFAVYAGTKGFLLAWTKSLAREVGRFGVTVNAVCPGSIVTDMNRGTYTPQRQAEVAASLPLRRMGDPEDVAAAVAYLAAQDGGFLAGQCIDVNGGSVMP